MRKLTTIAAMLLSAQFVFAQPIEEPPRPPMEGHQGMHIPRTISVSGSAEKFVEPDRIFVELGYGEYWEEEFEEGKEWKDYRTKVPIEQVEPKIVAALKKLGFKDEEITVQQVGNNYRPQGKDFLVKKTLEIKLQDFSKMNELVAMMDMRGIDRINVARMEADGMEEHKLEVKIEALKAAKYKAGKMVEAIGEDLGPVLHITESSSSMPSFDFANRAVMFESKESMDEMGYVSELENFRKIKVSYSVSAVFGIE